MAIDLLIDNGKVITVDDRWSIASAVAVKDGKILAVGGKELVERYIAAHRLDLAGRTLMPGFIDTHLHVGALSFRAVEVDKARSIAHLKAMVAAKAKELGPGEWIIGRGWDEALFTEKRVPSRADLDAAAPHNPVVLMRAGAHSAVANSMAFGKAGITAATPDPEGGLIERSPGGEPSGIIRERSDLLARMVPRDTPEQLRPGYVRTLKALLPLGITSLMEAFTTIDDEPVGKGGAGPGDPGYRGPGRSVTNTWSQFRSIYEDIGADLPRMTLYIAYPGAERLKAFPYRTGHGDDRLKLGPIGETPYDGGFSGPTALTKEDYKDQPGFRGTALMTPEEAREMIAISAALGWQLGIHAIGDAAIETVAPLYHESLAAKPKNDHRWFLSHFVMLPSSETMDMMARDGIYAAAQPNSLRTFQGRYEATLDGHRLQHINPVATPLRHGVKLAFGSDNAPKGPMFGIHAAVTRRGADGRQIGPEEAVSRATAIRLYTREAAMLSFDEAKKGSIEPGKFADMIVLDRDLLEIPDDQILATQVDVTIIGGKIVYSRPDAAARSSRENRSPKS